jgi:hypothetical protein
MRLWLYVLQPLLLLMACCGGSMKKERLTLYVASEALVTVDQRVAEKYRSAAEAALAHSDSANAYHLAMSPWDNVEEDIRIARAALFGAEEMLDGYSDIEHSRWACAVLNTSYTFTHLAASLDVVGIEVDVLVNAIDALKYIAGNALHCGDSDEQ